jgi:hypothetical protein
VAISGNQWNVTPDTTFADQWERCDASGASCADIAGATTPTYNVTAADVGHTLRVRVTGTDPDGSVPAISAPSAVTIPAAPRWKSLPTIGADPGHVGDTLTIGAGVWTGPAVATDVIELMRCLAACQPISGFSGSHYMIASADAGAVLRVRETATNAGGTTVVWSSWYVGPVISASSGVAALTAGAGAPVAVRNANGRALAFAQVALASTPHALMAGDTSGRRPAATPRVVRIRRAGSITGKLRVWVCTVRPAKQSGAPAACTAAVLISGKTGQVRLPATMTGKLRVIVVRQRR